MNPFTSARLWIALGGGVLIVAIIALLAALNPRRPVADDPPPAARGGLVVETQSADDNRLDPARPLRCFVAGRMVGEMTVSACAARNGVATGPMDVGLEPPPSPASPAQPLTVAPPPAAAATASPAPVAAAPEETGSPGDLPCWRYGTSGWRRLPGRMNLDACVQTLFSGRCERPGAAAYARWGETTLRLVTGKVEASDDDRAFRTLARQDDDCQIPPVH
jgi:hypothetical protein